jgi:hypothetical protein
MEQNTIDVTGLPESVVRDLRQLVATLRQNLANGSGPAYAQSAEEWSKAWREWIDSHTSRNPHFDDSREIIYAGRGE